MLRDDGKDEILNLLNCFFILKICLLKIFDEINGLVKKYVDKFLRSVYVLKKFRGI